MYAFWYLPTNVMYTKILAHVCDHVQRFYGNCWALGLINLNLSFVKWNTRIIIFVHSLILVLMIFFKQSSVKAILWFESDS